MKLFKLFKEKDATQIEINPLSEVEGGGVLCMDAKLGFDDNAEFRQQVSSSPSSPLPSILTLGAPGCLRPPRSDARRSLRSRSGQIRIKLYQTRWIDRMFGQRSWSRYGHDGRPQSRWR